GLYRGVRLAEAEAWTGRRSSELNPLEREFVEESRAATGREAERLRRTNRRLRGLLVGVALFLVLALVAGALALVSRGQARHQATVARAQRDLARTQAAASASLSELTQDPEVSLLLALEATKTGHTPLVDEALRKSILDSQIIRVLRGPTAEVNDLAFSSEGSRIV